MLVLLALWLVTRLDRHTVLFSFVGAALTVTYPFMKRFFPLPQFYLGAAFGWAVPMAFVATVGRVPKIGWLLFIVTLLWAGVYDTLYAMVDRDDDLKLGVQSTAVAFGDMDQVLVGAMQAMVIIGLLFAGHMSGLHWPFHASLLVGAGCSRGSCGSYAIAIAMPVSGPFSTTTTSGWWCSPASSPAMRHR